MIETDVVTQKTNESKPEAQSEKKPLPKIATFDHLDHDIGAHLAFMAYVELALENYRDELEKKATTQTSEESTTQEFQFFLATLKKIFQILEECRDGKKEINQDKNIKEEILLELLAKVASLKKAHQQQQESIAEKETAPLLTPEQQALIETKYFNLLNIFILKKLIQLQEQFKFLMPLVRPRSNEIDIFIAQFLDNYFPDNKLNFMQFTLTKLGTICADYQEIAKLEADTLVLQPIDLTQITENIIQDYQDTQLKIDFSTPFESTRVMGSPAILRVILNNLLSNVVKYGKKLDQRSNFYQRNTLPTCEVSITREDNYYLISITDQGDGMNPEEINSLLDLEKAKVRLEKHTATELQIPGSGLGLRIVMKAVEKLGGEFGIDSDPGVGSTFWFKIPKIEE